MNEDVVANAIVTAIDLQGSFTERIHFLIDQCAAVTSHGDWDRLRTINYEADAHKLGSWLNQALSMEGPAHQHLGLWFGLRNPVVQGQPTTDLYVSATEDFSLSSIEWAVNPSFHCKHLESAVLNAICRASYVGHNALQIDAEYPLGMAYGAMAAIAAMESVRLPRAFQDLVGAALGFDAGDYIILGRFYEGRFCAEVSPILG